MATVIGSRRERMRRSLVPFLSFFNGPFGSLSQEPDVADFAIGNP